MSTIWDHLKSPGKGMIGFNKLFWSHFFIIVKSSFYLLLLKNSGFDCIELLHCKVVELILKLPDSCVLHLINSFFRERILMSCVFDVSFTRVLKKFCSTRKIVWKKLFEYLDKVRFFDLKFAISLGISQS